MQTLSLVCGLRVCHYFCKGPCTFLKAAYSVAQLQFAHHLSRLIYSMKGR